MKEKIWRVEKMIPESEFLVSGTMSLAAPRRAVSAWLAACIENGWLLGYEQQSWLSGDTL